MDKILFNHDPTQVIGKFVNHNGMLFMEFTEAAKVTIEMLYESLPGAGFKVVEKYDNIMEGDVQVYVKVAQVLEFSILPRLDGLHIPADDDE